MTYPDFLRRVPIRKARTESRFDLRIYVSPKGHGFLFGLDGAGGTIGERREIVKIPYGDRQAALRMFEDLLRQAETFAQKGAAQAATSSE